MVRHVRPKYCVSIAAAVKLLQKQVLGYTNRSAFLIQLSKCKEELVDINKALISIIKFDYSKFKFLCRKVKCMASSDLSKVKPRKKPHVGLIL